MSTYGWSCERLLTFAFLFSSVDANGEEEKFPDEAGVRDSETFLKLPGGKVEGFCFILSHKTKDPLFQAVKFDK